MASATWRPAAEGRRCKLIGANMPNIPHASSLTCFEDIARHHVRGQDYAITVQPRPESHIAIIAPHGGSIEPGTSEIARRIAQDDFNLYLFEGIRPAKNYTTLHLDSRFFDEPECLDVIANCSIVVAIHGCTGEEEKVFLGGLNNDLRDDLARELQKVNVATQSTGHPFPAKDPKNICNRGLTRSGTQLEITAALRASPIRRHIARTVRSVVEGFGVSV